MTIAATTSPVPVFFLFSISAHNNLVQVSLGRASPGKARQGLTGLGLCNLYI